MDFDTLIVGGSIIDGTGGARRAGDVGVRDGRIAAIGSLAGSPARVTIDASRRVVAPGFIDMHSHSDVTLLDDPGAESKVHQGVTTDVTGNCSHSPFPVGPTGAQPLRDLFGIDLRSDTPWDWVDVDGWAARHRERGISINLAPLVGHGALRVAVGLTDERPPTADDLSRLYRLAAASVERGAFGLSTGLTLPPSSYATSEEIIGLARAIAPYEHAFYATHSRLWAGEHVQAVQEAADVGRASGIPVQYSHIAIVDRRAFGTAGEMLTVVERARADGVDMAVDVYPYTAAGTGLIQLLPEWAQADGVPAMLARLRNPATRARVRADAAKGWFRGLPWDWDSLVISDMATARGRSLIGMSLAQVAQARGADPLDTFLDLIDEEDNAVIVVAHNRSEGDMRTFLAHEASMVGSDGSAISPTGIHGVPQMPHPRYYGTFPRVLGKYARDEKLLDLEAAVHKMTGMPARRLGLSDRGVIAEGAAADIVILDPDVVLDQATFEEPHRYPLGIETVLVNGDVVIRSGTHTGARPGQVLLRGQ